MIIIYVYFLGNRLKHVKPAVWSFRGVMQAESCNGFCICCLNQDLASRFILLVVRFVATFQPNTHWPAVKNYKGESCCELQNATTKCDASASTNYSCSIWLLLSAFLCSQSQSLDVKPDCCGFLNMLGLNLKQQDLSVKGVRKVWGNTEGFPQGFPLV